MVASPRVMYIECSSGVAGDMLLAALIDAGVPVDAVTRALGSLGVDHELVVSRVMRAGLSATRVDVRERPGHQHDHGSGHADDHAHAHSHPHTHDHVDHHGHRPLSAIVGLIESSSLSSAAKQRAVALLTRMAEAEAAIHDMAVDAVHLHEVGATDSIIDIAGVVFAMEWLAVDDVVVSPLNVGGGSVEIAHGRYPVPAPATLRLLAGAPVYSGGPDVELVTPTGALLVSGYARAFGRMPPMTIERVGYGAGMRDFKGRPNVVRVVLGTQLSADVTGESQSVAGGADPTHTVVKIECEVDDMNPQLFEHASDQMTAAGALDVFLTAVQMKKGRPGTLLTVIAPEDRREGVVEAIFRHTTTIGVRFTRMMRDTLERRWVEVTTPDGPVRVKVSGRGSDTYNAAPEYDDCLRIAQASGRTVKEIQAEAMHAWLTAERQS